MKSRLIPALALATALGSTLFIAVRADAQQNAVPRVEDRADRARGPMARMSPEDRAAFLDARLAAVKAGLKLTPDQEKLWPAIEDAVHDGAKTMRDLRDKMRSAARPADPLERMSRMADAQMTRGDSMRKFIDAAKPLFASLSDDQKRRLPMLMHGPRGPRESMGDRLRQWWHGEDGGRGERRGSRDRRDDDRPARRDRDTRPDNSNPERL
jgi:zinc resistance-associated protein